MQVLDDKEKARPERDIEERVRQYAKKLGIVSRKMNGQGFRDWPDRLFIGPGKKILWIEFKRYNAKPTPSQKRNHKLLRSLGFDVRVVDNVPYGKATIEEYFIKG